MLTPEFAGQQWHCMTTNSVQTRIVPDWLVGGGVLWAMLLCAGCAGPGPRMFPVTPHHCAAEPDGATSRFYDTDGDGRVDYCERLSPAGRVDVIRYDADGDGRFETEIALDSIPASERRDLVLLLDSVPYQMVADAWAGGRFRLFPAPARVIAPFPVMTDLSFSEFFGDSPCPGVESEYYDGHHITDGYGTYAAGGNTPWQRHVDYHLTPSAHAVAYFYSYAWYLHELGKIDRMFEQRGGGPFVGYVVGTSALGAQHGRDGHQTGLIELDRFCQSVVWRTRGRVRITLFSDHGHNLMPSSRVPLPEMLAQFGYRVRDELERPEDVIVPQFGVVTYASIHTNSPRQVATDVVGIDGIELAAYLDEKDGVVVFSRGGEARITRTPTAPGMSDAASAAGVRFRYEALRGDPLKLRAVIERLRAEGRVDASGFVSDADLFAATTAHEYPDVVHRLWRAFHGLTAHTPDVMVAVLDGWHSGSRFMTKVRPMAAAHGNLGALSSSAFAMTSAGALPEVVRMEDLRARLEALGVQFRDGDAQAGRGENRTGGASARQ